MREVGAPWLIEPPANPSPYDDEFETDELDPKWSRKVQGAEVYTPVDSFDPYDTTAGDEHLESLNRARRSWLMVQPAPNYPSTSGAGYGMNVSLPEDCFFYTRVTINVRRNTITDGDGEVQAMLRDPVTNDLMMVSIDTFTNIIEGFSRREVGGVGTNIALVRNYFGEGLPIEYLGIQRRGLTYDAWCASSAGHWLWLGGHTFPTELSRLSIFMRNRVTTTPGRMILGMDFVRFIEGRGPF